MIDTLELVSKLSWVAGAGPKGSPGGLISGLRLRLQPRLPAALLGIFVAAIAIASVVRAEEPKTDDAAVGRFYVDAALFSYQPGEEITTYRGYSSGGAGPNATLGLGISEQDLRLDVRIVGKLKSKRFLVTVTITPNKRDAQTKPLEVEYDLTDIKPQSLEIAKDASGRVYRLNLTPRIVENPKVEQFKVRDLRLESWSFPASPVIVNDQDYIGELSMSYGSLAWCDIPGLAKIEFSLLHLKNAAPIGTLSDGVINITHDSGTTLRITNVKNGTFQEVLPGGPYKVWVRWNKPTQSVEEFHESLKQQIAMLKERVKNEDLSLSTGALERLKKMSESDHIGLISFGVSQVNPGDLAEQGD